MEDEVLRGGGAMSGRELSPLFWLPNQPMFASEIIKELEEAITDYEQREDDVLRDRLYRLRERLMTQGVKV